jgi:hypothetical protein
MDCACGAPMALLRRLPLLAMGAPRALPLPEWGCVRAACAAGAAA